MNTRFNGRKSNARFAPRSRSWLVVGLILFAVSINFALAAGLTSPATSTNALPTLPNAEMPSAASSVFRVLGALALVIAILFGGTWAFRNWQRVAANKGQAPKLNILETKSLGQRHAIFVVGYEQQRLLIASSPSGVTMLTILPAASTNASEEEPVARVNFTDVLRQALQPKS